MYSGKIDNPQKICIKALGFPRGWTGKAALWVMGERGWASLGQGGEKQWPVSLFIRKHQVWLLVVWDQSWLGHKNLSNLFLSQNPIFLIYVIIETKLQWMRSLDLSNFLSVMEFFIQMESYKE